MITQQSMFLYWDENLLEVGGGEGDSQYCELLVSNCCVPRHFNLSGEKMKTSHSS